MDNSLIVSTYKQKLYCCCYLIQSFMACCTASSLFIWDFASLKLISCFSLSQQYAPISLTKLSIISKDNIKILIQSKQGTIIIVSFNHLTNMFSYETTYKIDMLGFCRISIFRYNYDEKGLVKKDIEECFYTIKYNNILQKRQILSGKILCSYEVEDCEFQQITFLLTCKIDGIQYFYIFEQGASVKKIKIPELNQNQNLQVQNHVKFPSKQEVKLILWVQPTYNYQAYLCLRNDNITIINLITLQSIINLNYTGYRVMKSINLCRNQNKIQQKAKYIGMSSKNGLKLIDSNNLCIAQNKIPQGLILDMDICQFGMIAISQEGKILFLPIQL